ncbi:hypothetical protein CUZ56_00486 [Saezia sanguinis]|uniref:PepSY domain-containing protein n=1 Tax=Saezia sanguinis TaxID=1965230 RepID=A0A433SH22_9BURK|nr:hypothetical protein [Saezia sanguinis]RUS67990.1 hypothetical protein CUZ56_00473 [Saezia sanguinis]RUS68003.1 hypothetical protein CUZ56_00486 [Saezia sanguinis]
MKKFILSIIILISFHTLSVAQQSVRPITEAQAIEIAKQVVIARGSSPDWSGVNVSTMFKDDQWIVLFEGKPNVEGANRVGNHFAVIISSEGEVIKAVPGA